MMGLFSQEWELRWFTLAGTVMRYYKTERDASLNPRGIVDVAVSEMADGVGATGPTASFKVVTQLYNPHGVIT